MTILWTYAWWPVSHRMASRGESKTRCRARVSSTAPRLEPRCPLLSATDGHDEVADLPGQLLELLRALSARRSPGWWMVSSSMANRRYRCSAGYRVGRASSERPVLVTAEPALVPLVDRAPDDVTHAERQQATDRIEEEVVGRHDDAEQREERVGHDERAGPALPGELPHHQHAPGRPGDVEAGHGGVLVGHLLHRAGVERPRAALDLERVHEAVRLDVLRPCPAWLPP